ncbi:MAG: hypothetical protein IPN53_25670 [Comamonadaceae bacterium]|nr:hypothetical protein [Comamonadaceae bacterium]
MLGLDLAGDEGSSAPEQLAQHFTPAFADCVPLTIHAGEGEAADHIWQAAYHLHADRALPRLTLAANPQLAKRFRERRTMPGTAPQLQPRGGGLWLTWHTS